MINRAESIVNVRKEAFEESEKWFGIGVWEGARGGRKGENLVEEVRFFAGLRVFWGDGGITPGGDGSFGGDFRERGWSWGVDCG
jgi:hypothetical protein